MSLDIDSVDAFDTLFRLLDTLRVWMGNTLFEMIVDEAVTDKCR